MPSPGDNRRDHVDKRAWLPKQPGLLDSVPPPPEATFVAIGKKCGLRISPALVTEVAALDAEWVKCLDVILANTHDRAQDIFRNQANDLHTKTAEEISKHDHREFADILLECEARLKAGKERQKGIARKALAVIKPVGLECVEAYVALANEVERSEIGLAEAYSLPPHAGQVSLSIRKAAQMLAERMNHDAIGNRPSTILSGIPIF